MCHPNFIAVLNMILSKPASVIRISCLQGWHRTGVVTAVLWAILHAAGVQVLIIMEKLSWDVSSDCWFAKQFLSVEMDWRYAHGRIMRNHGMTSDQWIAVANRTAETLFEFLLAGERWTNNLRTFFCMEFSRSHLGRWNSTK
ncbi:unnamed protein product [Durusdinium trenchii]|uniref:Tyrosine specific protein phosphatases domain-containing protein n=1 Tax=Durusdinium trenchii TaxID=1381693 RepID=A0ABP0KAB2_9DINO